MTDAELDSIFKEMDEDNSGYIDIDEFLTYIKVADKVKAKDPKSRDAVFNIRKAHLKLNALDLLLMFKRMPATFVPSFSQHEMENRNLRLPVESIQPEFNFATMKYVGLEKTK